MIASIRDTRDGGVDITFGTRDVRDLSGGQLPAVVVRVDIDRTGERRERQPRVVRTANGLMRAVSAAGRGSLAGAREQWVEIRPVQQREVSDVG